MIKERAAASSPVKASTSVTKGTPKQKSAPETSIDPSRKRGRSSTEDEISDAKIPANEAPAIALKV